MAVKEQAARVKK
jgi:hypothetical protein